MSLRYIVVPRFNYQQTVYHKSIPGALNNLLTKLVPNELLVSIIDEIYHFTAYIPNTKSNILWEKGISFRGSFSCRSATDNIPKGQT